MASLSHRITPEARILADLERIEAAHLDRVVRAALPTYAALGQLVACLNDYRRHGAGCAEDLDGALRVAQDQLARIEGAPRLAVVRDEEEPERFDEMTGPMGGGR